MGDYLQIWDNNMEIRLNELFIIIPYKDEFNVVLKAIKDVCSNLQIKTKRADDIKQGLIMNTIFDGINHSEIIIADISGNNPNVFFELGIAMSRRENAVIVISQSRDEAPFDIRNWQVLQYQIGRLEDFRNDLAARIQLIKSRFGVEQLRSLLLTTCPSDKRLVEPFITLLEKADDDNNRIMNSICQLLSGDLVLEDGIPPRMIEKIDSIIGTIVNVQNESYKDIANYLRVLLFSSPTTLQLYFREIRKMYLSKWKVDPLSMKELPVRDISSKICFRIVDMDHKKKKIAIDWMMHYLGNKRMGRIDPVRANISQYLIVSKDKAIEQALLRQLEIDSGSSQESVIDICGQKCLYASSDKILTILKGTNNPFIARSCMYALSRMGNTNAAEEILMWMDNNRDKWGTQAVSSNLKKDALNALSSLNPNLAEELRHL